MALLMLWLSCRTNKNGRHNFMYDSHSRFLFNYLLFLTLVLPKKDTTHLTVPGQLLTEHPTSRHGQRCSWGRR